MMDQPSKTDPLSLLLQISSQLNSSLNLDEVLRYAMDQVVGLLNAERGFIMLVENGRLVLRVAKNFNIENLEKGHGYSQGVIDEAFKDKKPILTVDAMDDHRFSARESVVASGLRSVLCVPIASRNQVLGIIHLDNRWKSGVFTPRDLDTLVTFANHAAIAIENAKLYQNLKASINDKLRLQEEIYQEKIKNEIEREASNLREELAHHIVHDLRNPLTVVYTAFSLLDSMITKEKSPDEEELLIKARTNLKLLARMINDILDVYRLENGELKPVIKDVDLSSLVREIFSSPSIALSRNVQIRLRFPGEPFFVQGDESLLMRIFTNLISNAARYTKSGYIEVKGIIDPEQSCALVDVGDTGPGIPEVYREKIFSKFIQVKPGNHPAFSKGLGLAFCRLALEAHGGSIHALDNPEGGSIFRLTIPFQINPANEPE
ncbi:GAF domain-containing protein [bacterium]|nr:GAF domain-containing protein [candidate division CSSED10-310 bacterium]